MTMSAATQLDDRVEAAPAQQAGIAVEVYRSLAEVERVWRALETRAVLTPYQRFDWIAAYAEAGFEHGGDVAVILVTLAGRPIALLPFEIVSRFGLRVARLIGMPISNGDAPVFDPDFSQQLNPATLHRCFCALGADLVTLHCVAARIGTHANPFAALPGSPAPDHFYANAITPADGSFIEQSLPRARRANIRRSRRRLEEGFGAVRLHRAQTEAEIDTALEVFLDQRERRFIKMGVENVFARPAFRRLFRRLAMEGLGNPRPAMSIHALYAGDRIVATSIGSYGPNHYSQYINSTDYGEAARFSLMGVTLSHLLDALRDEGITSIDMGLGDFDYKLDWTHKEVVEDIVVAVSPLGRLSAPALRGARALKRRIKQTPAIWQAARWVRSAVNTLRRAAGS